MGPGGYSSEFYKILVDQISDPLTQYYNSFFATSHLRAKANNTFIKVLSSQGKIPSTQGYIGQYPS